MKRLTFSPDLSLPADAVTRQFAIVGRTGSGKSFAAGKLAECLLGAGNQVVILDPVGIWYGLRIGAQGGAGIKIPVFGGLHGDVPLQPEAGAMIANLIVDRAISVVLDVSSLRKAQARRFVTDFAEELFEAKKRSRSPLHLILEEGQRFVPQKSHRGDERMLGAFEDLTKIGRNFGIGWSIITQRPQAVNKDALNQADPLLVFQSSGSHERKAIEAWVHHKGVAVAKMVDAIPNLPVGTCYFWSPQWMGKLVRVKVGKKRTYDASATPEVGTEQREPKPLSVRDLKRLGQDIERVAQEAVASDPRALRRRIAELEAEVAKKPSAKTVTKREPYPVLSGRNLQRIEAVGEKIAAAAGKAADLIRVLTEIRDRVADAPRGSVSLRGPIEPLASTTPRPAPAPTSRTPRAEPTGKGLRRGAVRMLQALATMDRDLNRGQIAMLSGMSLKSGTFTTYLGDLRREGLIVDAGANFAITTTGVAYLNGNFGDTPRTPQAIADLFRTSLRSGAWRMLQAVMYAHPGPVSRDALAVQAEMSDRSGTFTTYLGDLKRTGMVVVSGGEIRLSDDMLVGSR